MTGIDVIVVGGGLAGAAFALETARNGARVMLLERSRQPTPKVCGDFLSGEALAFLDYLGVDPVSQGAHPIGMLHLSAGKSHVETPLPFEAAGFSRLRLDEMLLDRAGAAGVNVMRGVFASGLVSDGRTAKISTTVGTFEAATAVLGTGKHNLRGLRRPPGAVTAFKLQVALPADARSGLAGLVRLALFDGGHIGVCLVENELATLCWQIDTHRLREIGLDWHAQLCDIARKAPSVRYLLEGGQAASTRPSAVSNLPFGYIRRHPIAQNIYPVGDQMAVVPSFTGDGTAIALSSGIEAAHAFLAGKPAGAFQSAFADKLRRQFALATGVNSVMRSNFGRTFGVQFVARMPSIAKSLARATRHDMAMSAPQPFRAKS